MDILAKLEDGVRSVESGNTDALGEVSGGIIGAASVPVMAEETGPGSDVSSETPAEETPVADTSVETVSTAESSAEESPVPAEELVEPGADPLSRAAAEAASRAGETASVEPTPAPAEETSAAPSALMQAHTAVENAKQAFLDSRRKIGLITRSDDSPTVALKESIRNLDALLTAAVPATDGDFAFGISSICMAYESLIRCCNEFATHIGGKRRPSSTEIMRLNLSRQILAQSEKELGAFNILKGQFISGARGVGDSWTDILYSVRSEELNRGELETVGAGTSTIYVRTEADGSKRYIKPEEKLAANPEYATVFQMYAEQSPAAKTLIQSLYELPDAEIQAMDTNFDMIFNNVLFGQRQATKAGLAQEIRDIVTISWFRKLDDDTLMDFCKFVQKKRQEFETAQSAGIEAGKTISDRNVSSTRVAESLGMGDIVARSETVMITREDGTMSRANSMAEAKGVSIGNLGAKAFQDGDLVTLSPDAAKQLFELQIFDLITGQVDRNAGNYLAEYSVEILDEVRERPLAGSRIESVAPEVAHNRMRYTITSITGIDNDMAFGTKLLEEFDSQNMRQLTQNGLVSIPFLPQDFYDRLMDPALGDILKFGQLDLRSDDEIKALLTRLEQVRQTLKILVNSGKIQIIGDKSEWDRIVRERINSLSNKDEYAPSYASLALV